MEMKEINEKTDENMITDVTVYDWLPELEKDEFDYAVSHSSLSWVHMFMDTYRNGQTNMVSDIGVHLQRVNENTARCISVVDHPHCFVGLSMMKVSFETANLKFEISPYTTLVVPYIPEDDRCEDTEDVPGLEVA